MIKEYKTIFQYAEIEHTIQKSRFIGYAKPVSDENEAIEFIESIKNKHKNATHNVPVYVIGQNFEVQKYSEDGEPAGTAGMPVLDMLKKEDIKYTAIVVTRYFGGIKLGTGGLVRAYTATAKLALAEAKIVEKVLHDIIKIRIEYSLLGKMQNELFNNGYTIKDTVFDDAVNIYAYSQVDRSDQLRAMTQNITSGKADISILDTLYLERLDGKLLAGKE
ncbi:YigZ family protein [Lutibacter sp. B2]|nr:YigZ family protein [Lutibacter sp. B2]